MEEMCMPQTIIDLWNGNIAPCEHCGTHDPEVDHLIGLIERNRGHLCEGLTAAQKEVFQKYIDSSEEYLLRMLEPAFCDGFCLGSRLVMESIL